MREAISADPMGNHVLELQLEVLKNKNGPSGMGMMFEFMRWCMRFEDLQYKSKPDELPENTPPADPGPLPTDEELGFKKDVPC